MCWLQMCSHRNVWEDPTAWVIDNYPWSSETVNKDWPSLLHLRPEDVGREGGSSNNVNSCSNNNFVITHDNKDVDEATFNPELPRSEVNPGSRTSEDPLVRALLDENEMLLGYHWLIDHPAARLVVYSHCVLFIYLFGPAGLFFQSCVHILSIVRLFIRLFVCLLDVGIVVRVLFPLVFVRLCVRFYREIPDLFTCGCATNYDSHMCNED